MIIRGPRKERDFTILSNAVLRDERLSFKARGMLVFGLSQEPGYRMTREELAGASPNEGQKSIRNGLGELEARGYLRRQRLRRDDGSFAWESVLYEVPQNLSEAAHESSPTGGQGPLGLTSTNEPKAQVTASGPQASMAEGPSKEVLQEVLEPCAEQARTQKRARDPLWDALIEACGFTHVTPTPPERGAWNKALKDIRAVGATPGLIHERARAYRKTWPNVRLTPSALARHWGSLGADETDSDEDTLAAYGLTRG